MKVKVSDISGSIIKYAMMAVLMVIAMGGGCKKKLPTQPQDNNNNEYTYPLNISNDELNSYGPNIAIDTRGRVYVLWFDAEGAKLKIRDENDRFDIYYAEFPFGRIIR